MRPTGRRRFLQTALRSMAALAGGGGLLGSAGCERPSTGHGAEALLSAVRLSSKGRYEGRFVGQHFDRGHRLRDLGIPPAPSSTKHVDVAIVGSGIAGLAAARALAQADIDDYRLFELEDEAGGNSRGGVVGGFACPWGAHYVPVPGPYTDELADLLTEFGLRRIQDGHVTYDELHLCHSPQERLYIAGAWQEGLLPIRDQGVATFDAYRRFADRVKEASRPRAFTIPTASCQWDDILAALDAQSFAQWLDQQQLSDRALRWYLDYCCHDDYGAGLEHVSAWAGLHYFASRHGFSAPGTRDDAESGPDQLLTWPEGNAYLARRLAAPHAGRTTTGSIVLRVDEGRDEVAVDVLDAATGTLTRWKAKRVIVCTPLFVAARLLANPPDALRVAARSLPHAPWIVANLQIDEALIEHPGNAPLSWDNVLYDVPGLGYVNAMNQSTQPYNGATVLSYYRSFGNDPLAGRQALLDGSWDYWSEAILSELSVAHPDLRDKVRRIEIMRYGHAMAIPAPGVRGSAWLAALRQPLDRIAFAHSDLSAYSVFEEAFHWGLQAGSATASALRRS